MKRFKVTNLTENSGNKTHVLFFVLLPLNH